jgi:hypothetical protein
VFYRVIFLLSFIVTKGETVAEVENRIPSSVHNCRHCESLALRMHVLSDSRYHAPNLTTHRIESTYKHESLL